eukprot:CAMPEP_0182822582 /NCGR_PEP_ID=MMETSP0006_2-20121128/14291_1 /TAXON_ID=97485 /ORGANISM="Prymnesium parvum, Strain Texoma1" /LENGTH=44 /DNA_ID= /DNA_START= /DNA_END= /DNA_ORIENTATION=
MYGNAAVMIHPLLSGEQNLKSFTAIGVRDLESAKYHKYGIDEED